jgi:monoamine oxidase
MPATHKKVSCLILGAGMAGLGAGIEAQRQGIDSLILEADARIGGLCKNTTVHGCDF